MKTTVAFLTTLVGLGLNYPAAIAQSIVTDGTTTTIITPDGNRFDITGGNLSRDGQNLFHSFEKFGLDAHEIANFLSNPTIVNILTRVTGGNASIINGLIQVTGGNSNLFIMNPAGIIFGSGASLNVPADFTATTATGISFNGGWFNAVGSNDYTSLVGNPTGFQFSGTQPGTIINGGNLSLNPGQNLALMAGTVINTGTLNSPGGNITVSAVGEGGRVRISQEGQLLSLEVDAPTDAGGNVLPFTVKDLPALLTGNPVETNLNVTPTGQVQIAQSGAIIPTTPGTTIISGNVNASEVGAARLGGEITLTGDRVGVVTGTVDASGTNGGGTVLIGGDLRGGGTIPQAQETSISADSGIHADALIEGNGGQIVIWSNEITQVEGVLTARGGQNGGNGGLIETSSKDNLIIKTTPNASAINGIAGIWLIDPTDVEIVNGGEGGFNAPQVNVNLINQALNNGTSVTITTTKAEDPGEQGNITQASGVNINKTTGGNVTLTYDADNKITIEGNITATSGQLNLNFTARGEGGNAETDLNTGINIQGSTINTNGGSISFDGTGGAGINQNTGIFIDSNTTLNSGGGAISLTGRASLTATGAGNDGIFMRSTTIDSGGGSITITGTGGTGSTNNTGVQIVGSTFDTFGGDFNITGTASSLSGGELNGGIEIESEIEPTPDGTPQTTTINTNGGSVTFSGTGGAGTNRNGGIIIGEIRDDTPSGNLILNSGGGSINFTGQGGITATGQNNRGISIENNSTIDSEGGLITFEGTGGGGTNQNTGIVFNNFASVNSGTGEINLTGTANSATTGELNRGININNAAVVQSTDGNITLQGTGGNGIQFNEGVLIQGEGSRITSNNGNITIIGNSNPSAPSSPGINIDQGGLVQSTGSGEISLTGDSALSIGILLSAGGSIEGETGAITLTSDEIILGENTSLQGTGILTLRPFTPSLNITLGNASENGGFNINSNDLARFQNEFSQIIIGRQETENLTVTTPVTFSNPVTLQGVDIIVDGTITGIDDASITLNGSGNTTTLNADIITAGNPIIINDNVELNNNVTLSTTLETETGAEITVNGTINSPETPYNLTLTGGSGNISILGAIGNEQGLGNIAANSSGTTRFNGTVNAQSLTTDASGTTEINTSSITTTGNQTYNDPVTIGQNTTLTAQEGVNINNSLNSESGETNNLTLDVGNNDINLNQIGTQNPLGTLQVNSSGTTSLNGEVNVQNLTTDAPGNTSINVSPITTTGEQTYNDPVTLEQDTTLQGTNITFGATVGGGGNLQVNASGNTAFNGAVNLGGDLITDAPGTTEINTPSITTTGNQTYNDAVTLEQDTTLQGTNVTFGSTVAGGGSLEINASENTSFNGAVNLGGNLTTDEPGTTEINTSSITTTGNQTYNDPVTIGQNTTLTAQEGVNINNSLNSESGETNNLTLDVGNNDINLNQIGTQNPLGTLQVNSSGTTSLNGEVNVQNLTTDTPGNTSINVSPITTTGEQTYNDPVTLEQDTTLQGTNITFGATVGGGGNLQVNASGNTAFNGAVNLGGDLITDAPGSTTINTDQITSNRQIYNDRVTSGNTTNLTGNEITFNTDLDIGTNSLTLTSDNQINFPASGSGTVTSSSGSSINLNPITPSRNIVLGTSAAENSLQIRNISQLQFANLNQLTIGIENVTPNLEIAESITFSSPVTLQALNIQVNQSITGIEDASITINGSGNTTTLNADIVTEGNPITINDNVRVGNNVTLKTDQNASGGNININGTINSVNSPQNLTLTSGTGNISVSGAIGNQQLLNDLTVNSSGIIQLNGGLISTTNNQIYNGNIQLGTDTTFNTNGNYSAESIGGQGTGITIQAGNITTGNINSSFAGGTGGQVTLTTPGNITTGNIITGSDLQSPGVGGNITLNANGNINTANLISGSLSNQPGGNINLSSNGTITTGLIVTGSLNSNGGTLTLNSAGNIQTGPIFSGSLGAGNGGNISIISSQGGVIVDPVGVFPDELRTISVNGQSITLNGLNSSANLGNGGDVTIEAPNGINTQQINTNSQNGNGGDVTLESNADIQVTFINAQGGNTGIGGTVNVNTDRFFRATGIFIDQTGVNASISTDGGLGGGDITIRHGGNGQTEFTVGNPDLPTGNGTAGNITNGEFNIDAGNFLFTEQRGNVAIISVPSPPPPPPEPPIEIPQQDNPFNIPRNEQSVIPDVFQPQEPTSIPQVSVNPSIITINTLSEVREILRYIEQETAEIPALVYVGFTPPSVLTNQKITEEDIINREANFTAQYQGFLNLPPNQNNTVLSIIPEDDYELEIILVTQTGEPYRIQLPGVTRKQVIEAAENFYIEIANTGSDYKTTAKQLYDWLLKPLQAQLQEREIDTVLFFMPSGLRLIPIAALYDEENDQFVVQKDYTVGLAPSLNLIDYRYRDIKDSPVLAFGASQFPESEDQNPLPAVNIELPLITQQIRSGSYFLNEQFTLENVRQERNQDPYPIVHFATHADFDPENPTESYIQLYNQKLRLDQWRVMGLEAPTVDLLVISACETAVGNPQIELGFGGMAVQAGVKTAIASLWYVGDTATLVLMDQLYRQLKTAPIKAQALQQAQRTMLENQFIRQGNQLITPQGNIPLPDSSDNDNTAEQPIDFSHPFYWSSFTLIGSPW
ncbi:filamentous hemagglutinin family outer membrane protein [Gloeothece citriformis PCC 7424]|uniref:Filamentous hemagglutinin family outer membrane protein n=1 Tax=Gloeothece citriformis (strain PCC 7424) TaxID=65393 RepID=B7KAW4_GLOC7|nr:CHAT domain-containing protein [Gloeothece citriformis]ACK70074.1 filamentous hemagglutinin family outer membrane protein [Gloeothece citriformis PCC 7424]